MRSDHSAVGKHVTAAGGLDHQQADRAIGLEPPHGAAGQHDVIAIAEFQVTVVAKQPAGALVHEQKFVPVGVAHEVIHR